MGFGISVYYEVIQLVNFFCFNYVVVTPHIKISDSVTASKSKPYVEERLAKHG